MRYVVSANRPGAPFDNYVRSWEPVGPGEPVEWGKPANRGTFDKETAIAIARYLDSDSYRGVVIRSESGREDVEWQETLSPDASEVMERAENEALAAWRKAR